MRAKRKTIGVVLAMLTAPAAWAQIMIVPPCAPPAEFANWRQHHPVTAATRIGGDLVPELGFADRADLTLAPIASVSPAIPFGKPPLPGDHGGILSFRATQPGTYRIALGGRAWIDVAQGGKPIASVAHAMGPTCAGIAKRVDFPLTPGTYTIQLSAAAGATMPIEITRLP